MMRDRAAPIRYFFSIVSSFFRRSGGPDGANAYRHEIAGDDSTAKDFRTRVGTVRHRTCHDGLCVSVASNLSGTNRA